MVWPRIAIKNAFRDWGNLGSFFVNPASVDYINDNLNSLFIDVVIKRKGFSSQAVYAFRNSTTSLASFGLGKGFNFQGGYVFNNNMELAARYTNINAAEIYSIIDETEYALSFL